MCISMTKFNLRHFWCLFNGVSNRLLCSVSIVDAVV